eukprot:14998422-Ditylum_brightwellii.AAC.1
MSPVLSRPKHGISTSLPPIFTAQPAPNFVQHAMQQQQQAYLQYAIQQQRQQLNAPLSPHPERPEVETMRSPGIETYGLKDMVPSPGG